MMSEIAGWVGFPARGDERPASLADMLRSRAAADGLAQRARVNELVDAQRALGQLRVGAGRLAGEGQQDSAWCAIDGHPRWTERRLGDMARTDGDAAALADGYARNGVDVVRSIAGSFRLAVVEPQRVLLAVDRVASLPLFVTSPAPGMLIFASSLDGLLAHPTTPRLLSAQAIAEYLHFQVLHGGHTVYHGIEKLQPAQCLIFDDRGRTLRDYWHVDYAPPRHCSAATERDMRKEMMRVLRASVHRAVESASGNVGAFLSGGLDSSTVLGMAAERVERPVDTFTVRFDEPGYDESAYAEMAVTRFGARAHVYTMTPDDMVDDLARIVLMFDGPFGNASAAGAYHCAELARQVGVSTLLSGDGGDEVFAGGDTFVLMQRFELLQWAPARVRAMLDGAVERLPGVEGIPLLRRARSYVRRSRIPMPARIRSYEYLSPATCGEVFTPEFLDTIDVAGPGAVVERIYAIPDVADTLQRHLHYALNTTIADDDVPKVRRTCAWHGIEARFPLIDDDVLSFVASVPSNVLIKHLHERAFYRDALRTFLPTPIIEKPKQCFSHPLAAWLSRPTSLRCEVVAALDSFAGRGIVRGDLLRRLIADPSLAAHPNLTTLVWYMTVLERWLLARDHAEWS